jgi:hypothetical protein
LYGGTTRRAAVGVAVSGHRRRLLERMPVDGSARKGVFSSHVEVPENFLDIHEVKTGELIAIESL